MANPEHVEIVKQGAEAIVEWRDKPPVERLALSGADLSGADLRIAKLREVRLFEMNLSGANLREADLREANLGGAKLFKTDLSRANLSEACSSLKTPDAAAFRSRAPACRNPESRAS